MLLPQYFAWAMHTKAWRTMLRTPYLTQLALLLWFKFSHHAFSFSLAEPDPTPRGKAEEEASFPLVYRVWPCETTFPLVDKIMYLINSLSINNNLWCPWSLSVRVNCGITRVTENRKQWWKPTVGPWSSILTTQNLVSLWSLTTPKILPWPSQ